MNKILFFLSIILNIILAGVLVGMIIAIVPIMKVFRVIIDNYKKMIIYYKKYSYKVNNGGKNGK